jgi:hypothetical protein
MQCNVNVLRFKEICVCRLKLAYGTAFYRSARVFSGVHFSQYLSIYVYQLFYRCIFKKNTIMADN